jgi:hypothetical protein
LIKIIKGKSIKLKQYDESLFVNLGGYDASNVSKIKSLSKRAYVAEERLWEVPLYLIKDLINLFNSDEIHIAENIDQDYSEPEVNQTFGLNNIESFKEELDSIQDENIKNWTIKALEYLPDYFFHIPASSTGKYHPEYCLGEGGLTRHCRAAAKIAKDLFSFNTLCNFTQQEQDEIISALLLHDGCKDGLNGSKFTVHEHPLVVCYYLEKNEDLNKLLDKEIRNRILNNIRSHMSQWNTSNRSKIILPLPETNSQKVTALCDYLASRKDINVVI